MNREFESYLRMAGTALTIEQMKELAHKISEDFGVVEKEIFQIMISNNKEVREAIYKEASNLLGEDLRSKYFETATNSFGEPLKEVTNRALKKVHDNDHIQS